ncbi:hypothetical protein PHYPSEUDO_009854 [Phytophthora pseudosyringae]|uniref:Uncharacterized protein n=1 Tax=Phytophthora pseudosyringae TaxID=221518 RepID=A0A8T1WCC1_9STRA|nr:hypothetical protein PHYPSEUDO_009854 [Phytophthora pseudosyringae]
MRVTYALQGLLAASTTVTASSNPQHIVLGTDGTVVVGADPNLYFRTGRNQLYQLESEQELGELELHATQTEPDELPLAKLPSIHDELPLAKLSSIHDELPLAKLPSIHDELPLAKLSSIHDELLAADDLDSTDQTPVGDEFSSIAVIQDKPPVAWSTLAMVDDDGVPGVYGSVVFAELSCCFVAFIGYLVRSIPLWVGFSRGQKCCLIVAFSVAFLYQFATLGWFFGAVTPELMLGLSSLITRMISLGMVPVTTTSCMGRAREICHEHAAMASSGSRKSSRNSRRHHSRT